MAEFMDYFQHTEESPRIGDKIDILPIGTMWQYVSGSFLNGFVNAFRGAPLKAYVLGRYTSADEAVYENTDDRPSYQEPPGSFKWQQVEDSLTKRQLFDLLTEPQRLAHTKLGIFSDDVLALFQSKLENGQNCYWFFWFDQDVSDCGIGRFNTDNDPDIVIAAFDTYVAERSTAIGCGHEPWPLPSHFFTGWMEF